VTSSVKEICDPRRTSAEASIRIARQLSAECPGLDIEVFQYLTRKLRVPGVDLAVIGRILEILVAITPPARLHGVLRAGLAHYDAEVRSKAAVAVGRYMADAPLLQRLLTDADARVRANTLEALWHMRQPEVEAIFMQGLSDSHHRVVANAMYGLCLIDRDKYLPNVRGLLEHPLASHRVAGAWLMGRIARPEHLPLLRPLLSDGTAEVRAAAFDALAILRSHAPAAVETVRS
jgi:HEAT repeat protein